MQLLDKNIRAFLALIRAGLWEEEVQLAPYGDIDFSSVYKIAERHGVVGLVAAGLEYVKDIRIPQNIALLFAGHAIQLEQRNKSMNEFIGSLVEKMRKDDVYGMLVKGQGLAQCYLKPLWRSSGDIDLFFSRDRYNKAVGYFTSLSSECVQDSQYTKSYGVIIQSWLVELHGTLRSGLSTRLDKVLDNVQDDVFYGGDVRSWMNGKTQVFLPGVNSDLFFLFTHFARHFYHHEFLIRQACDWCRFLVTYQESVNKKQLEERLKKTNLMTEWKAFAAFAVEYLGMPKDFMPFYNALPKWGKKAEKILNFAMRNRKPNRMRDTLTMASIFPSNAIRFLPSLLFNVNGMKLKERLLNNRH